jgi:hypothetical protein
MGSRRGTHEPLDQSVLGTFESLQAVPRERYLGGFLIVLTA